RRRSARRKKACRRQPPTLAAPSPVAGPSAPDGWRAGRHRRRARWHGLPGRLVLPLLLRQPVETEVSAAAGGARAGFTTAPFSVNNVALMISSVVSILSFLSLSTRRVRNDKRLRA